MGQGLIGPRQQGLIGPRQQAKPKALLQNQHDARGSSCGARTHWPTTARTHWQQGIIGSKDSLAHNSKDSLAARNHWQQGLIGPRQQGLIGSKDSSAHDSKDSLAARDHWQQGLIGPRQQAKPNALLQNQQTLRYSAINMQATNNFHPSSTPTCADPLHFG